MAHVAEEEDGEDGEGVRKGEKGKGEQKRKGSRGEKDREEKWKAAGGNKQHEGILNSHLTPLSWARIGLSGQNASIGGKIEAV